MTSTLKLSVAALRAAIPSSTIIVRCARCEKGVDYDLLPSLLLYHVPCQVAYCNKCKSSQGLETLWYLGCDICVKVTPQTTREMLDVVIKRFNVAQPVLQHKSLFSAIMAECVDEIKILATRESTEDALHLATGHKKHKVMKCLLDDCKVDVNAGYDVLGEAVSGGDATAVRILLQHKANVNRRNTRGECALHYLWMQHGQAEEICQMLLDAGVNVNAQTTAHNTVLHQAAQYGSKELIIMLLATPGIVLDGVNQYGDTPLYICK
jgi:hypothetical protein